MCTFDLQVKMKGILKNSKEEEHFQLSDTRLGSPAAFLMQSIPEHTQQLLQYS